MGFAARQYRRSRSVISLCWDLCRGQRGIALAASPQSGQTAQHQETVQTGPIDEPRGTEEKPSGPPIAKGIQAIKQVNARCVVTFSVAADALFQVKRWTLNPDAGQLWTPRSANRQSRQASGAHRELHRLRRLRRLQSDA